jgi:hypothetical protein
MAIDMRQGFAGGQEAEASWERRQSSANGAGTRERFTNNVRVF